MESSVIPNQAFILKGISATGKGTRVHQLLAYLNEMFDVRVAQNEKGKDSAFVIDEIKLLIIGKFVKSNKSGLISFSSIDSMHESEKENPDMKGRNVLSYFRELYPDYSMIGEGYPCMMSEKYRADFLKDVNKFDRVHMGYYYYENMEELQRRVVERSGQRIKGICWGGNKGFIGEFEMLEEEYREDPTVTIFIEKHNSSVVRFGKFVLNELGLHHLIEGFLQFSNRYKALRTLSEKQKMDDLPVNLLPQNMRENGISTPDPITEEELIEKFNSYHPQEPFSDIKSDLEKVKKMFEENEVPDTQHFNRLRSEYGLSAYHHIKNRIKKVDDFGFDYLGSLIREFRPTLKTFKSIESLD